MFDALVIPQATSLKGSVRASKNVARKRVAATPEVLNSLVFIKMTLLCSHIQAASHVAQEVATAVLAVLAMLMNSEARSLKGYERAARDLACQVTPLPGFV
eukprot:gnl/TRDRNA2_/TRDRNA2_169003_c1_seq2.p2 gnl/TRDRNA2_/TRDRNA2_169003_c1~~gnl/TRDRNA2_/TRDRNA2_169003_c1_seq2.p2  ORF type:complete len:101 (-),score=9.92 gnl/TRDRNA2_/TRDRNA2_169003_c1_seq2:56-358(-)